MVAFAYLVTLVRASEMTKYAAPSTAGGVALRADVDRHVDRCPIGEGLHGRPESALGEDERMDPERQVAQLGEGGQGLVRCALQAASDGRVATVAQRASRDLQLEAERDEPLLGAVMEVSLDPPSLAVAGLDDPRPRGADLLELGLDLALQAERSRRSVARARSRATRRMPSSAVATG